MNLVEKEISNETKTCEACGKSFGCGVNTGKCWCFEVDLSRETLEQLREDFKNCLCQECLEKKNEPRTNTK